MSGYIVTVSSSGSMRLVSPTGSSRPIITLPANPPYYPAAVSSTGRYIAFVPKEGSTLRILDSATLTWFTQQAPGVMTVHFTRPTGTAIVVTRFIQGQGTFVERRDFRGHVQLTIASRATTDDPGFLSTTDGTAYALTTAAGGITLHDNATGRMIRTLSTPARRVCRAERWWDAATLVASCGPVGDSLDYEVFLVRTDGGRWTQLTRLGAYGLGFVDAWATASGTVIQQVSTCGPAAFGTLNAAKTMNQLTIPGVKGRPALQTVIGTRLYVRVLGDCVGPSPTFLTYDLATKKVTTLGSVDSALVIDPMG